MIDWIEKLPEPVLPFVGAGVIWFGLNYAVLAERAIEKDQASSALPHCMETLDRFARATRLPSSGIGALLGVPELDRFEHQLIDRYRPATLSHESKEARCACAAARAGAKLRWDYAVHTASFRIISPQAASALTDEVGTLALSGVCGVLPRLGRSG